MWLSCAIIPSVGRGPDSKRFPVDEADMAATMKKLTWTFENYRENYQYQQRNVERWSDQLAVEVESPRGGRR